MIKSYSMAKYTGSMTPASPPNTSCAHQTAGLRTAEVINKVHKWLISEAQGMNERILYPHNWAWHRGGGGGVDAGHEGNCGRGLEDGRMGERRSCIEAALVSASSRLSSSSSSPPRCFLLYNKERDVLTE